MNSASWPASKRQAATEGAEGRPGFVGVEPIEAL